MRRAPPLLAVGILLLGIGIAMPAVTTSDAGCTEWGTTERGQPVCISGGTQVNPNPFKMPTIVAGFVIAVVGVSIWGLDID